MKYYYSYWFSPIDNRPPFIRRELIDMYEFYKPVKGDCYDDWTGKAFSVDRTDHWIRLTMYGSDGYAHVHEYLSAAKHQSILDPFLYETLHGLGNREATIQFDYPPHSDEVIARVFVDDMSPAMEENLRKNLWAKTKYPDK